MSLEWQIVKVVFLSMGLFLFGLGIVWGTEDGAQSDGFEGIILAGSVFAALGVVL